MASPLTSPLTLLMPVSPGTDPNTIGTALAKFQPEINKALTSVGTVHFARFVLLDRSAANLQPASAQGPFVIGVITEFDGDFDAYIQDFVNQVGAIFDALLAFVEGGKALIPVSQNVAAFMQFIAANDASQHAPNTGLYAAYPQTVQEILAAFS